MNNKKINLALFWREYDGGITSVNELGQQDILFYGDVKAGTYKLTTNRKGLQWIVARQGDWVETIGILVD